MPCDCAKPPQWLDGRALLREHRQPPGHDTDLARGLHSEAAYAHVAWTYTSAQMNSIAAYILSLRRQ
jgi:hypothetical protein